MMDVANEDIGRFWSYKRIIENLNSSLRDYNGRCEVDSDIVRENTESSECRFRQKRLLGRF